MTLMELSHTYEESAAKLRRRIVELRGQAAKEPDRQKARELERRVEALVGVWRELRDLTWVTAHYYDGRCR